MAEAMARLSRADVPGASAAIRQALTGATPNNRVRPFSTDHAAADRMQAQNSGSSVVISDFRSGGRTATRQVLIAPSGEAIAEYLLIDGAGHDWSGGNRNGTFADPGE
jgi:hypothetical protein